MVFAGACCFGILSTFVKVAYQEGYATGDISGSQACLGMCVLWLLYILTRKREGGRGPVWPVLLAGTTIGLCTHLYYLSVKWIPASVAIIFLMQFTWISMLLEWAFFRKRPAALQLAAMLLIMAGTVMASGVADARGTLSLKGILLSMGSDAVYGIYVVASGRVGNTLPALKKSALMMTGSTIIIFIIARPHFLFDGQLSMGLAKWALFLAFFGTIIPPLLFAAGIPKTGVVLGAILMTAELPVAVVTAHLVLKENMSLLQWAGVGVMLFAMMIGQKRSKE